MSALMLALCLLIQSTPKTDPVARVGDVALSRGEFGEWMVSRHGVSALYDYVAENVILIEADKRGLRPTDAELDSAYEVEHQHILEVAYGGNPERWVTDQVKMGFTVESAKVRRLGELRVELALANMIRADRDLSEQAVLDHFHSLYGDPAERVSIEILRFNAYRDLVPGTRPDLPALKQGARDRALKARAAWLAGTPLADLRAQADEPGFDDIIVNAAIPAYRPRVMGKEIDAAVHSLDKPGDVSQPIDVFDGTWLVRLVSREPIALEDVREQLVREMRETPVDASEFNLLRNTLMERYQPELLLH
jgi:hypothetical protein